MEVWGGTRATWSRFVVPGLDVWIHSSPLEDDSPGGDVYYLSSCASGRVTRMMLADVSGHGRDAAPVAGDLRDLMRRNVNIIDQSKMAAVMNDEFGAEDRFATALISTFFSPTRSLTVSVAGHPPALLYRAAQKQWVSVEDEGHTRRSMPIGVVDGATFASSKLRLAVGDMCLSYTDALFEARNASGEMLAAAGLLSQLNQIDAAQPAEVIPTLLERVGGLHPENLTTDDVTAMLVLANGTGVGLKDNLLAPLRLLGRGLGLR